MKKYLILYICIVAFSLTGCKKAIDENIRPSNDKSDSELLKTLDGLATATNGNYSLLVTQNTGETPYEVSWWDMSEFKGNNLLAVVQAYPQNRDDSYTFANSPTMGITPSFWRMSYRIIFGSNKIIDAIPDGQGAAYDQLKGENYFLRAMAYFNLARIYGRPYYENNADGLAVPLSLSSAISKDYKPKRNTVKEVYAQVIADLEKAENLMSVAKPNQYASKEAAWALLSRVYLYMGGTPSQANNAYNTKAIEYADKVIGSGNYTFLQGNDYTTSFAKDSKTNKEFIFAFRHDVTNGNVINEFLTPIVLYGVYFVNGEYAASPDYMDILNQNPNDLRKNFVTTEVDGRTNESRASVNKYNFEIIGAADPFNYSARSKSGTPYLRLAEMYLNKAEALAKLGRNTDAIIPLNTVRTRATAAAWTTPSLASAGMTVFQATLNERRLELAWEGHSSYDNFRNGLPMKRNYTDYFNTTPITIAATDKRVIYPLPPEEIKMNTNLDQNPL